MATSDVQICNLALGMIGAGRISALNDGSAEARACNAIYSSLRDEVLERHPWTFAVKRATLSQDATAPDWGYEYRYALPADSLRVLKVNDDDVPFPAATLTQESAGEAITVRAPAAKTWEIEDTYLLTSETEIEIRYIAKVTDPTKFSPNFVKALSYRMAQDLAMQLAKNLNLSDRYEKKFDQVLEIAAGTNARTDNPDQVVESGYVTARN